MSNGAQLGSEFHSSDRRRYVRQNVLFSSAELEKGNGGIILNISEGGVALHAVSEIPADELPNLRFQFSLEHPWIEAKGRIVWRSHSRRSAGVQFIDLPGSARERIRKWISQANEDLTPEGTSTGDAVESNTLTDASENSLRQVGNATAEIDASDSEKSWRKVHADNLDQRASSSTPKNRGDRLLFVGRTPFGRPLAENGSTHKGRHTIIYVTVAGGLFLLAAGGYFSRRNAGNQRSTEESAGTRPISHNTSDNSTFPNSNHAPSSKASAGRERAASPYGFVLQVAAIKNEKNAIGLADQLRQKKFSVFVAKSPGSDLYRVLVGPYVDADAAAKSKADLRREGVPSILQENTAAQ